MILPPCVRGVKYAHCFPACRVRRLKRHPDGSASTTWDYAGLLYNLYLDAGQKRCHVPFSNLSCPIPTQPLLHMVQHVADWVVPFPRSQHSPQIPPYSPFTSSLSFPPLRARELVAIIIIALTNSF